MSFGKRRFILLANHIEIRGKGVRNEHSLGISMSMKAKIKAIREERPL